MSRPRLPIDYKLEAPKVYLSLYRHAHQTQQQAPTATPDQFTRGLLLALRSAGLTVEPVPLDGSRWLIDNVVWLEVICASRDLAQARCDLRAAMHRQPTALVGYLLQFVKPLRWSRVQISDSWLGPLVKPPASAEDLKAQLAAIQADILTNLLEGDEDEA